MKGLIISLFAALMLSAGGGLAAQGPLDKQIDHGEYLARVGDCAACHTAPKGVSFTGGSKMSTPVGAIYSTNITPDKKTGIGEYTQQQFADALRKGIARDGSRLYPAMPYPSFSKISDADIRDLYLYFMHKVQPVEYANKSSDIPWPLNIRWPLSLWNLAYSNEGVYRPDKTQSAAWNRGAYLVQGLGHCGSCHTPRGIGFEEKALDQRDGLYLSGGTLEGWHAANLRGEMTAGLGSWSAEDISRFLKTGHTGTFAAFGSMVSVIEDSSQYMNDEDRLAIATYLKSLDAQNDRAPVKQNGLTARALLQGNVTTPGAQTYLDNCAACHRSDGMGYKNTFPRLAGNSALLDEDPSSLVSIIIDGSRTPVTSTTPTGLTMPGFGWRLSDPQIAELATFVRNSWGNHAPPVKEKQVKEIRKDRAN